MDNSRKNGKTLWDIKEHREPSWTIIKHHYQNKILEPINYDMPQQVVIQTYVFLINREKI